MSPVLEEGVGQNAEHMGDTKCHTVEQKGRPTDSRGRPAADRHPASGHLFLIPGQPLHRCRRASEGQGRQDKPKGAAKSSNLLTDTGSAGCLPCHPYDFGHFSLAEVAVHGRHPRFPTVFMVPSSWPLTAPPACASMTPAVRLHRAVGYPDPQPRSRAQESHGNQSRSHASPAASGRIQRPAVLPSRSLHSAITIHRIG